MSSASVIEARIGSAPSGSTGGPSDDLAREGARRLGIASLVWATLWTMGLVLNNLVAPLLSPDRPLDDAWPWPGNPVAAAVIVLSLGVFTYTRSRACDARLALDLGLLYEVLLAFGIGLVNQWTPNVAGLSWIAILIVVNPIIVPNTTRKTLVAALVAASMDPLGIAITAARGVPVPEPAVILWTYLPNYLAAGLALVCVRIIGRLGRTASELGSYQLGDLLGRGGMGEVYRATHLMLARPAAIKLIRPDTLGAGTGLAAEMVLRRFRREATAVASLYSPHTVAVYDFGVTGDGTLYYVMELLDGLDLDTLVKRFGPVPADRTVHFVRQACHSLAEAHGLGLIHRDIKPANLYTCRAGLETDFLKVLDFGLVKSIRSNLAQETLATAPGVATGTPAYMAPEIALAEPTVDHRADLYSLGCVAYWLLTGQLVFEAETSVKMMYDQIHTEPVPPSRRTELPIPEDLERVVLRCLSKDPAQRPADAQALARALAACDCCERWTQERAARWWQTHLPNSRQAPGEPAAGDAETALVAVET